jgi:hypothetical protein
MRKNLLCDRMAARRDPRASLPIILQVILLARFVPVIGAPPGHPRLPIGAPGGAECPEPAIGAARREFVQCRLDRDSVCLWRW